MEARKILKDAGVCDEQILAMKPVVEEQKEPKPVFKKLNSDQVEDVVNAYIAQDYIPRGWPRWAKKQNLPLKKVLAVVKHTDSLFKNGIQQEEVPE